MIYNFYMYLEFIQSDFHFEWCVTDSSAISIELGTIEFGSNWEEYVETQSLSTDQNSVRKNIFFDIAEAEPWTRSGLKLSKIYEGRSISPWKMKLFSLVEYSPYTSLIFFQIRIFQSRIHLKTRNYDSRHLSTMLGSTHPDKNAYGYKTCDPIFKQKHPLDRWTWMIGCNSR